MEKIREMSIDIETYSDIDLGKCGTYRYTESDAFRILLFGVSINGGPVNVYDLAQGEKIPEDIVQALVDRDVTKWAFNASFERVCLSKWIRTYRPDLFSPYGDPADNLSDYLDPSSWRCDLVLAAYNGLPLSLEMVGAALGLDKQKMQEGKELIRYFCVPCKPTKANGGRTRNLPTDATEKWELFKKYNKRDVDVELSIHRRLINKYAPPDFLWDEYHIDQAINDRGIRIDRSVVNAAIRVDAAVKADIEAKLKHLTGLENPNSVLQLKGWLEARGVKVDSLGKKDVKAMLKTVPPEVREVLELRQQAAKSSVKKYQAMDISADADDRCRGMFFFYGGARSGRWAGRRVQLQNLPKNDLKELDAARQFLQNEDIEILSLLYKSVPDVLSQLIRTAFIPMDGYKFIVSDFSAIEARVLSHLAGERWRSKVFEENGDIYCASASKMFGVPVEKHGRNADLRQKGKVAELALGYGGSVGALKAMGAIDYGVKEDELPGLVSSWRESNPHIVEYWWKVDKAVKDAVKYHKRSKVSSVGFSWESGMLFITLPSGRRLSYVKPKITINQFDSESVTYYGLDLSRHWGRIESYGPKFVENITQAISRDILCFAMKNLRDHFIVGHVHDELIIECTMEETVESVCATMGQTPPWLPGLVLRADGYETPYYKKD